MITLLIVFTSLLLVLASFDIRRLIFVVNRGYETFQRKDAREDNDYPPTYQWLTDWEGALPQHNLSLSYPEGKSGRYVKFSSEIQMLGWNNCLHERLMNSYLAYKSKRAYVFREFMWEPEHYPWPKRKYRTSPPRTPMTALLSGPTVGGQWEEGDDAPRAVSEHYFDLVCPPSDRRIIKTGNVKSQIMSESGKQIFSTWEQLLLDAPERCIEIQPGGSSEDSTPQVFDAWLWESSGVLSLWEEFRDSPISQLLETSPIVNAAIARNDYLFAPKDRHALGPRNVYDRMLAIHVRRGDFNDACIRLATRSSRFYGWNQLPFLPDSFEPPRGGELGTNMGENIALYMGRCLPTFDDIVKKIRDSRNDYAKAAKDGRTTGILDTLYILTNEHSEWLDQLKDALEGEGWTRIVTSRDLVLDAEGVDTGMVVDMDIARRAAVFIGNGWSSLTSNIVHRRLVDGRKPISIRFL
ncbi:hypothetical protein AGABI1DRAFT_39997 [Agaricus bisporus var. burnettii JB137-S8]|uniref:Uncharacterized protein n=1 Tax=Agaricus bisporus var. burnettii (strain JB137-S8 / ATCC MYA-4627 / FGSC 10392) TaxID=597362 RepID=K5WUN1_AGABU|nr:uncharacterized protein AGABI1DRAFT_39997 [Agaricus bisporus var. burnettii JB137-S8]EKM79136.1 hypothetical protein AGABI1DRAFT_39997 [Agaricus bisporus var. burnettii JB137-S8]